MIPQLKIFRSWTKQFTLWITIQPLTDLKNRREVAITSNVMRRYSFLSSRFIFVITFSSFFLTFPFCWQYRQPLWFENVLQYKEEATSWNLYSQRKYQYLSFSFQFRIQEKIEAILLSISFINLTHTKWAQVYFSSIVKGDKIKFSSFLAWLVNCQHEVGSLYFKNLWLLQQQS